MTRKNTCDGAPRARTQPARRPKGIALAATVGALSLALASCGGPTASPKLTLSKSTGAVGTVVQVSGKAGGGCSTPTAWRGFRLERTGASSAGQVLAMTPPVAPDGTWTASFAVPAYLGSTSGAVPVGPGRYEIVAHACKGDVRAVASFRVTSSSLSVAPGRSVAIAATSDAGGYWVVRADGHVSAYGDAHPYGSLPAPAAKATTIVGIARTYDNHGYWLAASDGHVYHFGDASDYGSLPAGAPGGPVTGIAATPTGHGYWLLDANGRVHGFGDAHVQGQPPASQAPYSAIAARPGGGYMVVGAFDAATYMFPGDVHEGGGPGTALSGAVIGIASTASGNGAWAAGLDGGVVTLGDATFHGYASGTAAVSNSAVTAIAATPDGQGYWLLTGAGTVSAFGDAHLLGISKG